MLVRPTKVKIDYSPEKPTWGVFAIEPIKKDEIIEECPMVNIAYEELPTHRFAYPKHSDDWVTVLPLGYAAIYNHSHGNSNADWVNHPTIDRVFQFIATRDIEVGEEVCTRYGDRNQYWFERDGMNEIPLSRYPDSESGELE
jgi:SET domain-containing protein